MQNGFLRCKIRFVVLRRALIGWVDHLEQRGKFDESVVCIWTAELAVCLAYLYRNNIKHRYATKRFCGQWPNIENLKWYKTRKYNVG